MLNLLDITNIDVMNGLAPLIHTILLIFSTFHFIFTGLEASRNDYATVSLLLPPKCHSNRQHSSGEVILTLYGSSLDVRAIGYTTSIFENHNGELLQMLRHMNQEILLLP